MKKTKRFALMLLMAAAVLGGCGGTTDPKEIPTTTTIGQETDDVIETTKEETEPEKQYETEKTEDEKFEEYKAESLMIVDDMELSDESTLEAMKRIEGSYWEVSELNEWDSLNDYLISFTIASSYFYSKFDYGTVGHDIGEKGWEAIRSLQMEDGLYKEKIQDFKEAYERGGNLIFREKYESGQYKVGVDIEPGEYVFFADSSKGYFSVSSDANGSDIISNGNFVYDSIMTIQDGEYLELSKCYAVPIDDVTELPIDQADMFKIGVHLPAGEYKLVTDGDRGYYCIYSDDRQRGIEANDNFDGQSYIMVSDGQYLALSRCHIEQ